MESKLDNLILPKEAVGHKITSKIPIVHSDNRLSDVQELLFTNLKNIETINYIYVVGKSNKLKGVFSIKEIFNHNPSTYVRDIMQTKIVKCHPHVDQEKVVRLAIQNNIKSVPIVDKHDHLLGILASDRMFEILDQETREDYLKMSGILVHKKTKNSLHGISPLKGYILRIPWIIVGLVGGLVTAKVIGGFSDVLEKNIILAGFIPLVAYVANAVGNQTQTLFIRDLAVETKISVNKYFLFQLLTSLLIATTCWLLLLMFALFAWGSLHLGFVIGMAVFAAIVMATFFAMIIPITLQFFKNDPAIGSGPFTTIIQDLLSVVIYFYIASVFI